MYNPRGNAEVRGTVIAHPEGEHHAQRHDPVRTELLTIQVAASTLRELRPVVRLFDRSWHRKDERFLTLATESALLDAFAAADGLVIAEARGSSWLLRVRDRLASDAQPPTMQDLSRLVRTDARWFRCTIRSHESRYSSPITCS